MRESEQRIHDDETADRVVLIQCDEGTEWIGLGNGEIPASFGGKRLGNEEVSVQRVEQGQPGSGIERQVEIDATEQPLAGGGESTGPNERNTT